MNREKGHVGIDLVPISAEDVVYASKIFSIAMVRMQTYQVGIPSVSACNPSVQPPFPQYIKESVLLHFRHFCSNHSTFLFDISFAGSLYLIIFLPAVTRYLQVLPSQLCWQSLETYSTLDCCDNLKSSKPDPWKHSPCSDLWINHTLPDVVVFTVISIITPTNT